jgi:hypothetical protein
LFSCFVACVCVAFCRQVDALPFFCPGCSLTLDHVAVLRGWSQDRGGLSQVLPPCWAHPGWRFLWDPCLSCKCDPLLCLQVSYLHPNGLKSQKSQAQTKTQYKSKIVVFKICSKGMKASQFFNWMKTQFILVENFF